MRSKCTGVIAMLPGDGGQIGAGLVLEGGLEAVDPVAAPPVAVLVDELQLVVVEPLAEPGDLDPLRLTGGAVDVQERRGGQRLGAQSPTSWAPNRAADGEVEAAAGEKAHLAGGRLLRDRDRRDAQDDALQRRRHGSRIGDVVAQVRAVVDPGDDQVGAFADQAEVAEADAVDRRAVGRVGDPPVVEPHLLDRERRASRDAARGGAAVGVRDDHVRLDAVSSARARRGREGPRRGRQW